LLRLARAPVELPETEATVGDERAHAPGLGERQGLAVVRLATLGVEPLGMGCDLTEQMQRMGADATRHLASWAALCPGHHESAGKHKSSKTRKGSNRWLRTALIEAAAGASRAKHSALEARFRRVLRSAKLISTVPRTIAPQATGSDPPAPRCLCMRYKGWRSTDEARSAVRQPVDSGTTTAAT